MTLPRRARLVAVGAPPVVLAVAGLTHPMELTTATAHHWLAMHVVLIPIFPLLAVGLWLLLADERGPLAWAARVAAFSYATFYGALDALNGVAAGVLVTSTAIGRAADPTAELRPMLRLGNDLGWVGSVAFLVAVLLTVVVLLRRHGRRTWPGAVLAVAAAVSFLDSHIYWPRGVLTLLVLAVGLVLLERARSGAAGRGQAGPGTLRASASG